jgi:hypothetical protein
MNAADKFDYSDEDWQEIALAVEAVRPSLPMSSSERKQIRIAAKMYLGSVADFERMKAWDLETSAQWGAVEKHCQPLADALAVVMTQKMWQPDYLDKFSKTLTMLKIEAKILSGRERPTRPATGYYREIFEIWTKTFGGKLSRSTNQKNERYGPCIRFVYAVTHPVMGSDAPTLTYIPDLIDAEKQRRKLKVFQPVEA